MCPAANDTIPQRRRPASVAFSPQAKDLVTNSSAYAQSDLDLEDRNLDRSKLYGFLNQHFSDALPQRDGGLGAKPLASCGSRSDIITALNAYAAALPQPKPTKPAARRPRKPAARRKPAATAAPVRDESALRRQLAVDDMKQRLEAARAMGQDFETVAAYEAWLKPALDETLAAHLTRLTPDLLELVDVAGEADVAGILARVQEERIGKMTVASVLAEAIVNEGKPPLVIVRKRVKKKARRSTVSPMPQKQLAIVDATYAAKASPAVLAQSERKRKGLFDDTKAPFCDLATQLEACDSAAKRAKKPAGTTWLPERARTKLRTVNKSDPASVRDAFGVGTAASQPLSQRETKRRQREAT